MKRFKKALRLISLIVLLILAVSGIGIAGGFPLHRKQEQDEENEIKTEIQGGAAEGVRDVE